LGNYHTQHFFGLVHSLALAENQTLKTDLRYFKTGSSGAYSSGTSSYRITGYTRNGDGVIDKRIPDRIICRSYPVLRSHLFECPLLMLILS